MNPMTVEMHEGYGDAGSLLIIIGWFVYLMAAYGIAHALRLSHKNSLRLWAVCNIAPIVVLANVGHFSVLPFLGISIVAWFSYAMGGAVFEEKEKERRMKQRSFENLRPEDEAKKAGPGS
jgi:hypothetical protein